MFSKLVYSDLITCILQLDLHLMFSDESSFYLQSPHAIGYFKNNSRNQAIKYMLHKEEFIDNHDFYDDRFNFENKYEKKDFNQLWNLWSIGNRLSIGSRQLSMSFGEAHDYRDFHKFEEFIKRNFSQGYMIEYEYG